MSTFFAKYSQKLSKKLKVDFRVNYYTHSDDVESDDTYTVRHKALKQYIGKI